ncbi:MAG: DUF5615 family PIN-like protein [Deltaproteobacteria bacterium]|nr:DUF5615 family PIN-like protein [Deltaproteobacteria bacterium]
MKLLFDENLSPRLVQALEPEYPGSAHVRTVGLRGATDEAIWELARQEAYAIGSKDNDFRQLSFLHGAPPKVIWGCRLAVPGRRPSFGSCGVSGHRSRPLRPTRRLPSSFSRSLRVRSNIPPERTALTRSRSAASR